MNKWGDSWEQSYGRSSQFQQFNLEWFKSRTSKDIIEDVESSPDRENEIYLYTIRLNVQYKDIFEEFCK